MDRLIFYMAFLQFVSKSLDEVDSEEWVCSLGAEMAAQIPLYAHLPEEKVEYVILDCALLVPKV